MERAELPFFSSHIFLKSVVDQTASDDLDLQEKVIDHLYTIDTKNYQNFLYRF